MTKETEPKICQIGLGRWGKNILRNLVELGVPYVACEVDPDTLKQRQKDFPNVEFTTSFDDVLLDPDVKGIVISTPAATHYKFAKQALLAGKDVFVEKPLALRLKEGLGLQKIACEKNKIIMVGHILRYHPAVKKLHEIISSGELGKLHYIASNRLNMGALRTEETILWSFAPHDISVMLMLVGGMPIKVTSSGGDYLNRGVHDITLSSLEFDNDVKGHIFVSWLHPYKEQKLVVVGSNSMALFDDGTEEKLFIYPHTISWKDGKIPIAEKAERVPVAIEDSEPLKSEMQHFIDCVKTRRTPVTDGLEGLRVLKVLQALEESLHSGESQKITDVLDLNEELFERSTSLSGVQAIL